MISLRFITISYRLTINYTNVEVEEIIDLDRLFFILLQKPKNKYLKYPSNFYLNYFEFKTVNLKIIIECFT